MKQGLLVVCFLLLWAVSAHGEIKLSECPNCECDLQGQCDGMSLGILHASSGLECSKACYNDPSCAWWTYDPSEPSCFLWTDCDTLDTNLCPECSSGEKICFEAALNETDVLFVSGMYYLSHDLSVELVPLDRGTGAIHCPVVPDIPMDSEFGCGFLYQDQPVVCAINDDLPLCYFFNTTQWSWTLFYRMNVPRVQAEGAQMGDNYFITGGVDDNSGYLDSTEFFHADEKYFSMAMTLPSPILSHCIAALNETHAVIIGGYNGTTPFADVFMIHVEQGTLYQLPSLRRPRYRHVCGLVSPSDGSQPYLVVVGGLDGTGESDLARHTETLQLDASSWEDGVPLPETTSSATPVPYGNSFLIVGGMDTQSIWQYDPDQPEAPWIRRPETLSTVRELSPSTIPVKATQLQCY